MTAAVKDKLIFLGWIAALVAAGSLIWSLSFPYRAASLMRTANNALSAAGDTRRIAATLRHRFTRPLPMGVWYRLEESDALFFVFVIMREGMLVPCGVEINENGKAGGIVPLGGHARQLIDRIPRGVIQVYIRRIESVVSVGKEAE